MALSFCIFRHVQFSCFYLESITPFSIVVLGPAMSGPPLLSGHLRNPLVTAKYRFDCNFITTVLTHKELILILFTVYQISCHRLYKSIHYWKISSIDGAYYIIRWGRCQCNIILKDLFTCFTSCQNFIDYARYIF